MKKILTMISVFALVANNVNAQLSVYANGYVGVATTSSPTSTLSVKGDKTGYDASIIGTSRGLYSESNGEYLNWAYGVYGKNRSTSAGFQCGTMGDAVLSSPQSGCRTYGVIGHAGNASDGWNYGVFGELDGTKYGAGVYGTATHAENGSYVDGRYAGYFNGATKVNGNLTVTGSINGLVLNRVSNPVNVSNLSNEYEKSSIADKFSRLSAIQYQTESSKGNSNRMEQSSDSVCRETPIDEIQALSARRVHYGFDIEQLKESFPELVYEKEDGTVDVNYVEMIPILVQVINNLNTEIKILKSEGSFPKSERSASNASTVIISSDGQIIGTKRSK